MTNHSGFYKDLLDNMYDGVYFVDRQRKITYWNKGAERLTGYKGSNVLGKSCSDNVLVHVDDKGSCLCKGRCPLLRTINDRKVRETEVYLHHRDGYKVPVLVRTAPVYDAEGKIIGAVEVFSDNSSKISAIKKVEELQVVAYLDPLTGVGNRRYAEMNLYSRLDELRRYGWSFGALLIDVDKFKVVNDVYGHDIGDEVLRMIAKTTLGCLRSFDFLGRWGGEEFLVLVVNVDENQIYNVANKIRLLVEKSSFPIGRQRIQATVSIGATLAKPSDTVDTLVKRADQLMYLSKNSGRNTISVG